VEATRRAGESRHPPGLREPDFDYWPRLETDSENLSNAPHTNRGPIRTVRRHKAAGFVHEAPEPLRPASRSPWRPAEPGH